MELPDGQKIFYLDKMTADYVVNEIFNDNVYLQHGISIQDGDVIFDIGANMGIASLYFAQQAKKLQIFTFEPVPAIFEVLKANMEKISESHTIKNYNIGLSEVAGTTEINFLPNSSGDSAIIPLDQDYKVRKMMEHYNETVVAFSSAAKYIPKFLRKFVVKTFVKQWQKGKKIPCQLRTLSEIIKENQIKRIDLLKIDAENYEQHVIDGIENEDWDKIQQIAMEVHTHIKGGENLLQELKELFISKGFTCYDGEESLETLWGVYMLYAKR